MRKLLVIFLMILMQLVHAQVPQALNYQAVARTADGVIIPTQNISVRFSVLDVSITGAVLYTETHQTTTNSYGLFTLAIGKGVPITSTFASINWASGTDKFLKVEIAPSGGSNYQLQGTTQLLSVPYALYSEKTRLIAGNNTINITNGNTITGNYQAANNTILLNGNTIAGNYQPANNTLLFNGNTIAGNYQPGTGINIIGNAISHNLVAGPGVNITGNTISAIASTLWIPDANGIHNQSGKVGIGVNSHSIYPLFVRQTNSGVGHASAVFESDDTWHSAIAIKSNPVNFQYTLLVGSNLNNATKPNSFAITSTNFNTGENRVALTIEGATSNIGIGHTSLVNPIAKSTLHVFSGDINIEQIGSGIILKSPNGNCWRITIDNAGNLVRTAITCL